MLRETIAVICLTFLVHEAFAGHTVEVKLKSFINPKGQDANGVCCDLLIRKTCNCPGCSIHSHCDYKFEICVDSLEEGIKDSSTCKSGWQKTNVVKDNTDSLEIPTGPLGDTFDNPAVFNFNGSWLGAIFKYRVVDDDDVNPDDLVQNGFFVFDRQYKTQTVYTIGLNQSRSYGAENTSLWIDFLANCAYGYSGINCVTVAYPDCTGWFMATPEPYDGLYTLDHMGTPYKARCDMTTDGGGWTVVQSRIDGDLAFNRIWREYSEGFGDPIQQRDYWLGLDKISRITSLKPQSLRIDLSDCQGQHGHEIYDKFHVDDATTKYKLTISKGTGPLGDSLNDIQTPGSGGDQNGQPFTTTDADNDANTGFNCANVHRGGWWYKACTQANLNGNYYANCIVSGDQPYNGTIWFSWRGLFYSMKRTEMKIRPTNFHSLVARGNEMISSAELKLVQG